MSKKKSKQTHYSTYEEHEEDEQKGFEVFGAYRAPYWWPRMDRQQALYVSSLQFHKVTFVDAGAGTGKTTIAVKEAIEALRSGEVRKIHYVRFVDERTQKLGFLPGNEDEKEIGFMYPFYEAALECGLTREHVAALINYDLVELSTDIHLRGRNIAQTFTIIDEAQNGTIEDLQLTLTRLHDNGRAAVIGHSKQLDRKLPKYKKDAKIYTPFEVYALHMSKKQFVGVVELINDYRGDISRWADKVASTLKEFEVQHV